MDYSLSADEVMKIANFKDKKTKFFLYSKLKSLPSKNHNYIVLYREQPNYGHFIAVLNHNGKSMEFYDGYGKIPDQILDHYDKINDNINDRLDQDYELSDMLYNLPDSMDIEYNEFPHQKGNDKICGRLAGLRCMYSHLDIYQFNKFLGDLAKNYKTNKKKAIITYTDEILSEQ